jgi:CzcA family heavy metal efflux pump
MWIVRLALRRPFTVAVLSLLILIGGWLSSQRMKSDILPVIDIPVVIAVWNYPGLSAEDMERRVVLISERAYSTTVSGIQKIESQSLAGIGILKIYFEPGADIGGAIAQVVSVSLTASRVMPPGIQPPSIVRFNAANVPVAQLTLKSETASEQQLFDYGLNFLRIRLFTIPGLSTPAPFGGRQRQVMIDLDPQAIAAKGLAPTDVVSALLTGNVLLPAGSAQIGGLQYDVKLNASPTSVQGFNDLPVKAVDGATVYLKDVARVRDGYAVQENVVRIDGRRSTYLAILKKSDASTLAVVDSVKELLPSIKQAAPEGIELKIDYDQSLFVRAAIENVLHEAVLSSLLVCVMIFFFLGSWRSMVIVCSSIPLAVLVGVVGLFLTGQTFNVMTLGGLALAIGMLVDDATVEVENIHRNRHLGKKLTVAILDGAQQIAVPALAATLTICIVFFPVVMLEGPSRFLFTPLALAVVVSMLASYLLSRTLVPALARKLMADEHEDPNSPIGRFNHARDAAFARFQEAYGRLLAKVLHHRGYVLGCGLVVVLAAGALPWTVGLDFFPQVDVGQMRLHFRAPVGTRLEETELVIAGVEKKIREVVPPEELSTITSNLGLPVFFNLAFVQTDSVGSQDADVLISLKPGHAPTERYMDRLREELTRDFPGAQFYFQPADIISQVLNFGLSAPIDVQVEGSDLEASNRVAVELRDRMREVPGTVDVRIAQVSNHPSLAVEVDRQRAAQIGLTERDVASNLLTSLSSSALVSPNFWLNPQNSVNYPVVVQTPIARVGSTTDLLSTPLGGNGGTQSAATYLGAVAQLSPTHGRASISHVSVQRVVDVQAGFAGRDLGSVTAGVQAAIDGLKDLPKGMKVTLRGQPEAMLTSFKSLGAGLILAVVLVYLLLVVLFQSWMDPFIILVAVPGALVGILWLLALTGTTLNVESFMGAIMAVGIAVSNSILLVSYANEVRSERGAAHAAGVKLDALGAALEAGKTRLRPVLMTALAMILGMLPMALALGEGSEQNAPLGRAVIGGLICATFVTLFIVPAVYSLLRQREPEAHQLDALFEEESRGASEASHA